MNRCDKAFIIITIIFTTSLVGSCSYNEYKNYIYRKHYEKCIKAAQHVGLYGSYTLDVCRDSAIKRMEDAS